MKVLVTGGAGFIGTNLIRKLVSMNIECISIDNYVSGKKENHITDPLVKYYNWDIVEHIRASWEIVTKEIFTDITCIFHLAAESRIQPSFVNPELTFDTNITGTVSILEFAKKYGIQVIYAGSSSHHAGIYKSPYAFTKSIAGDICKMYSNVWNLNTCITRFYNVYGPYQLEDGPYSTVIGIFEKQYRNKQPLTIVKPGTQRRDFTHVDDIVNGLIACIGKEFKGEVFELGRGENYSIEEVADLFGKDYPREYLPERRGEYPSTLCDYSYAKKVLLWEPVMNLKDYIEGVKNEQTRI